MTAPGHNLTPSALSGAIEENSLAGLRSWNGWAGLDFHENAQRCWTVSRTPSPLFNQVFLRHPETGPGEQPLGEILMPYRRLRVPCFFWTPAGMREHCGEALREAGLDHHFYAPGMAIELKDLYEEVAAPEELEVEEVSDSGGLETWCRVIGGTLGFSEAEAAAWGELHGCLPFGPGSTRRHFIARLRDEPVGTASLLLEAGVAGIRSVVVRRSCRRRGIGTCLSLAALRVAGRAGLPAAVLISSSAAAGVYRRLGFREYRRWECRLWSPG